MSAFEAPSLVVEVLGGPEDDDLVPADPGIECRRAHPGQGGAWPGRTDVLIVDLDGPAGEAGGEPVAAIRRAFDPERATLILAVSRDPGRAAAALAAGATDFALLPRDRPWLREVILRERDRRLRWSAGSSGAGPEAGPERLIVEVPSEGLSFEEFERRLVEHALSRAGWNRSRAARELAISRPRLLRKIERYGLEPPPRAPGEPPSD